MVSSCPGRRRRGAGPGPAGGEGRPGQSAHQTFTIDRRQEHGRCGTGKRKNGENHLRAQAGVERPQGWAGQRPGAGPDHGGLLRHPHPHQPDGQHLGAGAPAAGDRALRPQCAQGDRKGAAKERLGDQPQQRRQGDPAGIPGAYGRAPAGSGQGGQEKGGGGQGGHPFHPAGRQRDHQKANDQKIMEEDAQKATDASIKDIDKIIADKEKEIMEV